MTKITDYKSYGAILSAVDDCLSIALTETHKSHFGKPSYFAQRALSVHKAFDRFTEEHGMSCERAVALHSLITRHGIMYPHLRTVGVQVLCDELPDEFNVRGSWVSARQTLIFKTEEVMKETQNATPEDDKG